MSPRQEGKFHENRAGVVTLAFLLGAYMVSAKRQPSKIPDREREKKGGWGRRDSSFGVGARGKVLV